MWRLFSLSLLNLTQPWKFVIAPLGSTVASTASILSTSSTITGMHEAAGGRQPATAKPPLYVPGTTNMQRPKTFRSSAVTLTVLYYRIYIYIGRCISHTLGRYSMVDISKVATVPVPKKGRRDIPPRAFRRHVARYCWRPLFVVAEPTSLENHPRGV